ncbi:MAG: hypothetical protein ABFD92_17665 [Planctomycetaceae bacterium]|nr:hypothetical protein [Planctomycetaceae bacterium]
MKQLRCDGCGITAPAATMFDVGGKIFCEACCTSEVESYPAGEVPQGLVQPVVDTTVCAVCGADFGSLELQSVAGHPVCDSCSQRLLHYPLPLWVKAASLVVAGLIVFSLATNWRFFQGFFEARAAIKCLKSPQPDYVKADSMAKAAAGHVPESAEVRGLAVAAQAHLAYSRGVQAAEKGDFKLAAELTDQASQALPQDSRLRADALIYRGIDAMQEDRSAAAVECFRKARGDSNIPVKALDALILRAEGGAAFDAKDYPAFLDKARALEQLQGDDASRAQVASALACMYAQSGQDSYKAQALAILNALPAGSDDPHPDEYRQRILHRINTRTIISRKQYLATVGAASRPASSKE